MLCTVEVLKSVRPWHIENFFSNFVANTYLMSFLLRWNALSILLPR